MKVPPNSVLAVYREPFGIAPQVKFHPDGLSLAEMAKRMEGLPPEFARHGSIRINNRPVPREWWGRVRPRPQRAGVPVQITFHMAPRGGGEDGDKNPIATIAQIALLVAAVYISGGGLAGAFGTSLFAAGSFSANLLATAVTVSGSLLINALSPPPALPTSPLSPTGGGSEAQRNASIKGNVLAANGVVMRVVGEKRVYPPFLAEPYTYFDGPDEVTEAVLGLSGPHVINAIRSGGASVEDLSGVDVQTREGWPGEPALTLIQRYAKMQAVQAELRGHLTEGGEGRTLDTSDGLALALPQSTIVATREAPDEHTLDLVWPQGLGKPSDETVTLRTPFRLRLRARGASSWVDLPELHYGAATVGRQLRATIKLLWTDDADVTPEVASVEGWLEARTFSPGQDVEPLGADWSADSYFATGTGDGYLDQNNLGTTGVRRVILGRYEARIYLDKAVFAPGLYEVEIKRGAAVNDASYAPATYEFGGTTYDLFGYSGSNRAPASKSGLAETVMLLRSTSVWNASPVTTDDFALIAVRARNRNLDQITCLAAGYVKDWDGSGWNTWTTTSNPAPHLRDILIGRQNLDPIPPAVLGEDDLLAWRADCIAKGYACNASFAGGTVAEAAHVVASCGYARPRMSDEWGVVRDYDRSAEAPVQVFTPRNSRGYSWAKDLVRPPDGFRINFYDEDADFEPRQVTVYRPGLSEDSGRTEQVGYEGLTNLAAVTERAEFDFLQLTARGTKHTIETPAESIVCKRGSLVGLEHDSLSEISSQGRIVAWDADGDGNVTAIEIDTEVEMVREPAFLDIDDVLAVDDILLIGATPGVAIRRSEGSGWTTHEAANTTGSSAVFTFDPPLSPDGITEGGLVVTGLVQRVFERMIVAQIRMKPNLEATLTMVDEGGELWAA